MTEFDMQETLSSSCEGIMPQTVVNGNVNLNIFVSGSALLAVGALVFLLLVVLGVVFRKPLVRLIRKWMR